jgi:hypothetical protein
LDEDEDLQDHHHGRKDPHKRAAPAREPEAAHPPRKKAQPARPRPEPEPEPEQVEEAAEYAEEPAGGQEQQEEYAEEQPAEEQQYEEQPGEQPEEQPAEEQASEEPAYEEPVEQAEAYEEEPAEEPEERPPPRKHKPAAGQRPAAGHRPAAHKKKRHHSDHAHLQAPEHKTKAPPQKNYNRVRKQDVDFIELKRVRGRVVYRFINGFIIVIFSIYYLIHFQVYQYPAPWKITDPTVKGFNPAAFRFLDYQKEKEFAAAIGILLPPGTDKQLVDRLLGHYGHAHPGPIPPNKSLLPGERQVSYLYEETHNMAADFIAYFTVSHDNIRRWIVIVTYGPDLKIVRLTVTMDAVQAVTEAYTNISPQSMDKNYWQ